MRTVFKVNQNLQAESTYAIENIADAGNPSLPTLTCFRMLLTRHLAQRH